MKSLIMILFIFLLNACEEQAKDWTDDPKYDPKSLSLIKSLK